MSRDQYTAAEFIKAIKGSGGIVSTIASRVGCTWHTARKYIDTHVTVRTAYENECEAILDLAEGTVLKNIRDGDSADAKWYLTKKGKGRGYGDSVELTGDSSVTLRVVYDDSKPGTDGTSTEAA